LSLPNTAPSIEVESVATSPGRSAVSHRDQIFIAEHGSWNATPRVGYRITVAHLSPNADAAVLYEEDFITGWLRPDQNRWGRPVDVAQMPDGALLISDDMAGVVYRLTYSAN
jgi:glucose/arabinose dehydrogenase